MFPDAALVDRFRADLDVLSAPGERIGIAVSGGPDSFALLLLAAAVRPGLVEAATVDHDLRLGSADEAKVVASVGEKLGIRHAILAAHWEEHPQTAIQEHAREVRYRLLDDWLAERAADFLTRPGGWPETRYEAKARREGREVWYFRYRRC